MAHSEIIALNGDPNIGLYGIATDKYCLLGNSVPEKMAKLVEEILKVPVIQASVYGTALLGIFCAGNSKTLLLPSVIFDHELEHIKSKLKGVVKVELIKTDNTALANNILCNDEIAILSTNFSKEEVDTIKKALKVKAIQMDLATLNTPGSAAVLTNKGALFNPNLSEEEIKKVEKLIGFEIGLGSVNMGSPIVASGVIANSNGFLVGNLSSGYEISRVDESLRFI